MPLTMSIEIPSNITNKLQAPPARPERAKPRRMRLWPAVLAACLIFIPLGIEVAWAAGNTGLPLPRFVSLRKGEVNLRTGPGTRYPIDWVLTHKNMPVEITAEFESWRRVRDWQGAIGWVHKSMLSGRRWIIVRGKRHPLRRDKDAASPVIAHLDEKVIGRLKQCRGTWCRIDIAGIQGWIERSAIWGVYQDEKIR